MYATSSQKFLTYMGYYSNAFARESVRNIERLTHPMPTDAQYWPEVAERVKRVAITFFTIPMALLCGVPAMTFYALGACLGKGHFELIEPQTPADFWKNRSVKVLSINDCFQDP